MCSKSAKHICFVYPNRLLLHMYEYTFGVLICICVCFLNATRWFGGKVCLSVCCVPVWLDLCTVMTSSWTVFPPSPKIPLTFIPATIKFPESASLTSPTWVCVSNGTTKQCFILSQFSLNQSSLTKRTHNASDLQAKLIAFHVDLMHTVHIDSSH